MRKFETATRIDSINPSAIDAKATTRGSGETQPASISGNGIERAAFEATRNGEIADGAIIGTADRNDAIGRAGSETNIDGEDQAK